MHRDAHALAAAARVLARQSDMGALPFLAEIDVPVLIIAGGDDTPTLSAARFMGRAIPNATVVVVPRANHAANMHKPDAVNTAISEFLPRLPD